MSMATQLRGYNGVVRNLEDLARGGRLPALAPGLVPLPPSKSHALRALMISASARRPVVLSYEQGEAWGEAGDDIRRGIKCAEALGAEVERSGSRMSLTFPEDGPHGGELPVGESGFLGRVAPTCVSLGRKGRWAIHATGSLMNRSSGPLWSALKGAGIEVLDGEGWPAGVAAVSEPGPLHLTGAISSQELSALWIGLASMGGGEVRVSGEVPSQPYLELTRDVLGSFGAAVKETDSGYRVSSVSPGPAVALAVESDASAAAVALAAGCIGGVRLEVSAPRSGSAQGDWRIVEHLSAFGCVVEEVDGRLISAKGPDKGANLDLSGEPDLAPVLAAVAAKASLSGAGGSVISGLHTLDGKESRRGRVLCDGLRLAGFDCQWRESSLAVGQRRRDPSGDPLDPAGDHRMGFAFALLGVAMPEVFIRSPSCVSKSWPNFWSSMR